MNYDDMKMFKKLKYFFVAIKIITFGIKKKWYQNLKLWYQNLASVIKI